jgi:NAD-dependent histone deacetylase SIR2
MDLNSLQHSESSMKSTRKRKRRVENEIPGDCHKNLIDDNLSPPLPQITTSNLFDKEALCQGLALAQYCKIVFLVGAGVSVAAGIPDFRTPKIGLYALVKQLGLPHPEDIFSLEYFREEPNSFYSIAERYLKYEAHPIAAHRFMKATADQKLLHMVYTQNIDGLENDVGIPTDKLVQAHGHMRSAHCCVCNTEYDIKTFFSAASEGTVLSCMKCTKEGAYIKPRIIFFGEKLPRQYQQRLGRIGQADLVIVMGTSLKVKPFSSLVDSIPVSVPIVVINRDLPKNETLNSSDRQVLFLPGEIEATVSEIMEYLHW